MDEMKVEFLDDKEVSEKMERLSVFERAEEKDASKTKNMWRCFVLPVTFIVGVLLLISILLGVVEIVTTPTMN